MWGLYPWDDYDFHLWRAWMFDEAVANLGDGIEQVMEDIKSKNPRVVEARRKEALAKILQISVPTSQKSYADPRALKERAEASKGV